MFIRHPGRTKKYKLVKTTRKTDSRGQTNRRDERVQIRVQKVQKYTYSVKVANGVFMDEQI